MYICNACPRKCGIDREIKTLSNEAILLQAAMLSIYLVYFVRIFHKEKRQELEKIINEVEKIGYKAKTKIKNSNSPINEEIENNEISIMKRRLISSIIFLIPLMYISMGHMMWKFPLPQFLSSPLLIGISECILTIIIMVINKKFFINGFKSLINKSPNMDALVALGSSASFLYSFVYLIIMIKMQLFMYMKENK